MNLEEFTAEREVRLVSATDDLLPAVEAALRSGGNNWEQVLSILQALFDEEVRASGNDRVSAAPLIEIMDALGRTEVSGSVETQAQRIATWLATAALGAAANQVASANNGLGVEWITMQDEDVRPAHRDAHGQRRRPGQEFDIGGVNLLYPGQPVGPFEAWINCVLGSTKVAWPGQDVLALTRYVATGDFIDVSTIDGHHLTVTPNHPVLTTLGYIPAGALRPGDEVMAAPVSESPEVADGPPSIEQVYEAARVAGNVQRVSRGAVDFHGDIPDEEVEVVWADGNLSTELGIQGRDQILVGLGVGQGSFGVCGPSQLSGHEGVPGLDVDPASSGFMSGGGVGTSLAGGHASHAQGVGLASATNRQAQNVEPALDDSSVDAEAARHRQHALAFGVAPSKVAEVKRYRAAHPVYNLHTTENYYISNGIVTHNCRCVLRVIELADALVADAKEETMEAELEPEITEEDLEIPVPWYGVLAPEGIFSGDGRRFAKGALRNRDLPLPLRWMEQDNEKHRGSVVVGRIDRIWRVESDPANHMRAEGVFDSSPAAYESIRQIAGGMIRGVSVDVDDAEGEMGLDDEGEPDGTVTFTSGRISAATLCAIPAFQEAFVALGFWSDHEGEEITQEQSLAAQTEDFVAEGKWDGSASRFTDEQWKRSCIVHVCDDMEKSCHKLPIREPGGALSRAGVHAAAARINQVDAPPDQIAAAKAKLRSAYKELGEEPPDVIAAAGQVEEFVPARTKDGPGWVTHPQPTKRITEYWVHGAGAAKIGWGTPGDFNRCRANLSKYVQNPEWLAGLCANLHYRALRTWPGQHSVALTAAADVPVDYFSNPGLTEPTAMMIDGQHIYGHVATWSVCHVGISGDCVVAPRSPSQYSYFHTGAAIADNGDLVAVGQICMGGTHAGVNLSMSAARRHYADTTMAVADIVVGEDEHGIWFSGVLRDGLTDKQVANLRAAALSGDWRDTPDGYELISVLAVNVPGYPIPRPSRIKGYALTAAGVVGADEVEDHEHEVVDRSAEIIRARSSLAVDRARAILETTRRT